MGKKVRYVTAVLMAAAILWKGTVPASASGDALEESLQVYEESAEEAAISVVYQTHAQSYGWQKQVSDGQTAGTTGESKRLEALKIYLKSESEEALDGGIQYQAHVQGYGWMSWVSDGQTAGSTGESKRLEAVKIRLTGALSEKYDVYYRLHIQSFGWLGWAKNGEKAGSEGLSKRAEAIEICLVKKGEAAPGPVTTPYVSIPALSCQVHMQSYGWMTPVGSGKTAGVTGQSKRLEAIRISLEENSIGGSLEYRTHVQTYGWQDWVPEGSVTGTTGQSKRLEAIQLRLTGTLADTCDVYYRVHIQSYGWLDWAKNGEQRAQRDFPSVWRPLRYRSSERGLRHPVPRHVLIFIMKFPRSISREPGSIMPGQVLLSA